MGNDVPFDPMSLTFREAPAEGLRVMREAHPVFRHPDLEFPTVSLFRHADIKAVYRDFKGYSSYIPEEARVYELADGTSLIGEDPPVHTHLRQSVSKLFTAHNVEELRPDVISRCQKIFDQVLDAGEIDAVEDLAAHLSVGVISQLVGVPESDRELIRDWTRRQSAINGTTAFLNPDDPRLDECAAITKSANDEMQLYLAERVDERIASPRADVLTLLVQSGLSRQEAISFAKLLVMAGNETTTNLINNTIGLLIDHPDQDRLLRSNPDLVDQAIEESLRFRGPINYSIRTAVADGEIGGEPIRKDDTMILWIGSGNLDPTRFEAPDRFDIERKPAALLAFGHGLHACLGSPLARLEGQVFLSTLIRRTNGVERTRAERPPVPTPIFNGDQHHWVRLNAS